MIRKVLVSVTGGLLGLTAVVGVPSAAQAGTAQAGTAQAGATRVSAAAAFTRWCPYTLRPQYTAARIRSGPSTSYPTVDYWDRGEVKLVGEPAERSGAWRKIDQGRWITEYFIARTAGPCAQ